jgi:putative serine protease PepD
MDEDDELPPLLPPEDRLWRHPSEVGLAARARRSMNRGPGLLAVTALTSTVSVLLTLGIVAAVKPWRGDGDTVRGRTAAAAPVTPTGGVGTVSDVAALAERLRPAVTRIRAETPSGARDGSGVMWRKDGMIVTAAHLVDGASAVQVVLHDGRRMTADVKGSDAETDIAVLDVEGNDHETVALGSVTGLKVGQPAIVVGSPSGGMGGPVVSVGVVGAMDQHAETNGMRLSDLIQTAALAPGCAGGALVDADGKLIGIATANAEAEGGVVGYATPVDVAKRVANEIVSGGKVPRVWIGIEVEEAGSDPGPKVKSVREASPAAVAGLAVGDVVVELDGKPVPTMAALLSTLRSRKPGAVVNVTVVRGGSRTSLPVTLAERPEKLS